MRALLQRVREAAVHVEGTEIARIGRGLLVFVGVEQGDDAAGCDRLARRVVGLRIFPDDAGKMNRDVLEVGGELLVVSQFTLAADTTRGRRPGFGTAAPPTVAEPLCRRFAEQVRAAGCRAAEGRFGADMAVALVNDGPATFLLEARSGAGRAGEGAPE